MADGVDGTGSRRSWTVWALAGVLLAQLAMWTRAPQRPMPRVVRQPAIPAWHAAAQGEVLRLPPLQVRGQPSSRTSQTQHALEPGTCRLVVVTEPECGVSRATRRWWQPRYLLWRDSLQHDVQLTQPLWVLLTERPAVADSFYGAFPFSETAQTYLTPEATASARTLPPFVPLAFLTDARGRVRWSEVGPALPPAALVDSLCRPALLSAPTE